MPTGTPALPAQSRQSVTTRVNRPSGTSPGASAFPSSASPALAVEVAPRTLARQSPQGSQRFVFANTLGRSLDDRDVGEGFRQTIKSAGLARDGKRLSLHWLRHGYASLLVANELNVVFVSRQLGHANPAVTLSTYAHLFERADHGETAKDALEASYATVSGTGG